MTVNPFVKVSQYLADLAASYNQGEGSASSRDSLFLHDSEENHVESILDDVISNPTDHIHSVHLRLSSQRRRMAQEKIAAVRNNPLKFVSLANSSFAAGNGLAYKAREQMSIVEQQKAVRAHLLQMHQDCSNANDEEENNWQEHLELWRRKRISAILSSQTQETVDNDSKFENCNAKLNVRRHSAADVLDHATHSNTPFCQPSRERTPRIPQLYVSQNSQNHFSQEEPWLMPIAPNKRLNSNSTLLNINVNKWKSHLNNKSANRKLKSIPEVEDDTVLLNSEAELPLLIPLLGSSSSSSDDDAKTVNMHKESKPSRKKVFEMNKVKNGIEAIFPACGKAKFNKLEENVLIDFGNDLEVEREQLYGLCSFPRNGAEERKRPPDYNLMEIPRPKFVKEPRDDSSRRRITKSYKEDTYLESKPGYSSASVSNNLEQPLSLAKICSNSSDVLKLDNSAQEPMTNLKSYRSRVEVNSQLKKTLVSEVNDQHARNSPISKMDISPQVAKSNTIYELEKAREKVQNGITSVANISELIQSPMANTFANTDFSAKIEEKPKRKFGQVSAELVRLQPTSSLSMLSREWPMTYETCNKLRSVVKVEDNCIDAPIWSRKSRAMPSTYYTRRREQLKLEAGGLGNSLTLPSYYRRVTTGSQNLIRSKSADEAETKSILRIFVGPDLNGNLSNARQSDSKAPSTSNPSSFTPTNLTSPQSFVDNRETFTKETPNVRQFVRRIERSPSPLAEKIRAKSQPLPLLIRKKSAATNSEGTIFNKGNTKQNRESETVSTTSVEVELFREQSINVSASCTVPHKDYSTPRSRSSGPVTTRRKPIPFTRMPSLPSSPPPPVITGSSHQFRVVEINLDDASEPAPRSLHTPPKSFDTGLPLLNRRLRSTSAHGIISNTRNPAFPRSSSSTPSSNAVNQNLPNSARSQGTTLYQQFKQNKFANGAFSRPINSGMALRIKSTEV